MPLSNEHLGKIAGLITSSLVPLERRIDSLEEVMHGRFDEVNAHLDGMYARDEKREQEYLSLREQVGRLDQRVTTLERKVA